MVEEVDDEVSTDGEDIDDGGMFGILSSVELKRDRCD